MRKMARESAFKVIYKSHFQNNFLYDEIFEEDNIIADDDVEFAKALINLYSENEQAINQKIDSLLSGYTPDRVYKIDRAILGVAIAEILYYKKTPYKIVINEAVEMAKKYSTEKSYSFVNGLLKKVIEGENVI